MLTNNEKAQRLEEIASCPLCIESGDSKLLRECAAMMRERHPEDALWEVEYQRKYKRFDVSVWQGANGKWFWTVIFGGMCYKSGDSLSLPTAQAAAVAWVDQQEGK